MFYLTNPERAPQLIIEDLQVNPFQISTNLDQYIEKKFLNKAQWRAKAADLGSGGDRNYGTQSFLFLI